MCDLPENLQIIKREYSASPPTLISTEPISDCTIKTKLNLHVKRRLQHDYEYNTHNISNMVNNVGTEHSGKNVLHGEQQKFIRERKLYHKRIDKNKLSSDIPKERKCKYKVKQLVVNKEAVVAEEIGATGINSCSKVNAVGAGDDDDGSNENDTRIVRDKEKCPDVLSMVLSMKKRALFANSDVQKFLGDIITIMKT